MEFKLNNVRQNTASNFVLKPSNKYSLTGNKVQTRWNPRYYIFREGTFAGLTPNFILILSHSYS